MENKKKITKKNQKEETQWSKLSIIGFILVFFLPGIAFLVSITALIVTIKFKVKGRGLAIAGIIMSLILVWSRAL
jgi:heme/copper-type cytochrome/quinol oxidase subunit 4